MHNCFKLINETYKIDLNNKRIIISEPTRIGDVACCLPIVTVIKERYPNCHIIFLGQEYTRQFLEIYNGIDEFIDYKNNPFSIAKMQLNRSGDSILYRSGMNLKIKRNFFIRGIIHAGVQRMRFHRGNHAAHSG